LADRNYFNYSVFFPPTGSWRKRHLYCRFTKHWQSCTAEFHSLRNV